MSKEEIGDIVNPSLEEQLRVVEWLKNNNITDIKNFGDSIHISATKDDLKRIFRINSNIVYIYSITHTRILTKYY